MKTMIMKFFRSLMWTVFIIIVVLSRKSFAISEEEEFIKHFGNNPNNARPWTEVKAYYDESDHNKLKRFVSGAQRKISSNWDHVYFDVEDLVYKKGMLKFQNPQCQSIRVEVLGFKIHLKQASKKTLSLLKFSDTDPWFITQGPKKDCIYYLTLVDPANPDLWEFKLDKQLCGVKMKY